jgi:hypothetical protein
MANLIIDEFARANVEGRKPRLTAAMVKAISSWYLKSKE